jgi:CheY-like chemotaxis protein
MVPMATILVVDDEAPIRNLVCAMLEQRGYQVLTPDDGSSALNLSRKHPEKIRLLISDIRMPSPLDGFALAHRIRQECPDIRILLMSGNVPASCGLPLQSPSQRRTCTRRSNGCSAICRDRRFSPASRTSRGAGPRPAHELFRATCRFGRALSCPLACPTSGCGRRSSILVPSTFLLRIPSSRRRSCV